MNQPVHDGDPCADIDRQLDDAHGELNDISMWLGRRGVNLRREDGHYDAGAAIDELLARDATDVDVRSAASGATLRRELWIALGCRPCPDRDLIQAVRNLTGQTKTT